MKNIKERILELRKNIITLDELYESNRDTVIDGKYISDSEYDEMYLELVSLEKKYPEYYDEDSPTQKIILEVVDALEKVEHSSPMLSLEKETTKEGVLDFAKKIDDKVIVQDKLDGLTIVAKYSNGKLIEAITRGNGFIGENVIHTFRTIKNVPKLISFKGKLKIRFEAMIPYVEFEKINKEGEYSNPRNLASGTVRQLDAKIAKDRGLIAIAFDLLEAEGLTFKNDIEMLDFMKSQNFDVVNYKVFENSNQGIDELLDFIYEYESNIRMKLPYMVDGLVLKANDISLREGLGYTSKHPRWAIAYKFKSLEAATKIIGITNQVGKTGQITPVAELETVEIDNVNISRATLHNYSNIKSKDIRIGDQVVVIRANDVIPQVVRPLVELRSGEEGIIIPPSHCPACGANTELDGENLYCTGLNCSPQMQRKLEHFVSRNAMNIAGLGVKAIETFYEEGYISKIEDIYMLSNYKDEISLLPGYGEKSIEKILKSIESSKNSTLDKVLYGLSINHIGNSASKDLAKEFKTMEKLLAVYKDKGFKERLLKINGFGDKMSESLIDFLSNADNIKTINNLAELGVKMTMPEDDTEENKDSDISGLTFVITGKVKNFNNRKEIKEMIEKNGGKVTGSVSSNTDYLINNDINSNSSKNKAAKELDIPIIGEEELLNMI